jgi:hypothetical protein
MMPVWPVAMKVEERPRLRASRSNSSDVDIFPTLQSDPTVRTTVLPGRCGSPNPTGGCSGTSRKSISLTPFLRAASISPSSWVMKVWRPL